MKKNLLLSAMIAFSFFTSAQSGLKALDRVTVKNVSVVPVRVTGTDLYSFDGVLGGNRGCFRIDDVGGSYHIMNYNGCDTLSFEFAEYLNGNKNIPLYLIRRRDGNYLTLLAFFRSKLSTAEARASDQEWLISVSTAAVNLTTRTSIPVYSFLLAKNPSVNGYTLWAYDANKIGMNMKLPTPTDKEKFFLKAIPLQSISTNELIK